MLVAAALSIIFSLPYKLRTFSCEDVALQATCVFVASNINLTGLNHRLNNNNKILSQWDTLIPTISLNRYALQLLHTVFQYFWSTTEPVSYRLKNAHLQDILIIPLLIRFSLLQAYWLEHEEGNFALLTKNTFHHPKTNRPAKPRP